MFNDAMSAHGRNEDPARATGGQSHEEARWLSFHLWPLAAEDLDFPAAPRTDIQLHVDLQERAVISVALHSARGQRVRLLAATLVESGSHIFAWDGRDDRGQPLPGGSYEAKLEAVNEKGVVYCAAIGVRLAP